MKLPHLRSDDSVDVISPSFILCSYSTGEPVSVVVFLIIYANSDSRYRCQLIAPYVTTQTVVVSAYRDPETTKPDLSELK